MQQIRTACDTAKLLTPPALAGREKDAPVMAIPKQTLARIKARIESVIAYCVAFAAMPCRGGRATIYPAALDGNTLSGQEFLIQPRPLPISISTSATSLTAILRHNGVGRQEALPWADMPYREAA